MQDVKDLFVGARFSEDTWPDHWVVLYAEPDYLVQPAFLCKCEETQEEVVWAGSGMSLIIWGNSQS